MTQLMEQVWPYASALLIILGVVALIVLIVVLVRAAQSMRHINEITAAAAADLAPSFKRVEPLVDRAELTMDTLNLELLRVDSILEDVEQVTDVAGKTADTVNAITNAPTNAVASLAEKLRGALGSRRKAKLKAERVVYPIGAGEAPAEEGDEDVAGAAASVKEKLDASEGAAGAPGAEDAGTEAAATGDAAADVPEQG